MNTLVPQADRPLPSGGAAGRTERRTFGWMIAALIVFGLIPVALGIVHLATVAAGMDTSATALYFLRMPAPVALHVAGAAAYVLLAPLQFWPGFRRRAPRWHRASGRALVVAGLFVAISALWMTTSLPQQASAGSLLYAARLLFGTAMIASIALGFHAIRRQDVPAHRRWMTRGYAIGLGAATQIPVLMIAEMLAGPPEDIARAILMAGSWMLNLVVAEWTLRRSG